MALGPEAYTSVANMRTQGIPDPPDDAEVESLILRASRFIDRVTGRFFFPVEKDRTVDGRGGRILQLQEPIISVEEVEILPDPFVSGGTIVGFDVMKIYNRHLTEELVRPDDRDDPKIEFLHGRDLLGQRGRPFEPTIGLTTFVWPVGPQTVRVKGFFGYTDFDSSNSQGVTPDLIREVTERIVARNFKPLISSTGGGPVAGPVIRHKTRDQEIHFSDIKGSVRETNITGDPEIDNILLLFMRPIDLGAA